MIGLGGAWLAATTIAPLRALVDEPATQPSLIALQVWRVLGITFEFLMLATDGWANWSRLDPRLTLPVDFLVISPKIPTTIYAGTSVGLFILRQP